MAGFIIDDAAWASPWRTRSVRDKAILVAALMTAALVSPWAGGLAVAVVSVGLMLRVPKAVRILWLPMAFIIIGTISVAITFSWHDGLRIGVTAQSLSMARDVFCRSVGAASAMLLLATTTPIIDLLGAMRKAGIPGVVIDIANAVYRMIFLSADSVHAITEAQTGRLGYRNRKTAIRSAAMVFGATFLRTFDRAERMERGLAGRGYLDSLNTLDPKRERSTSFVIISIVVALCCAAIGFGTKYLGG